MLVLLGSHPLVAQTVRQSSWTIQDVEQGLRQDLASAVIERADEWLTRDDPDRPIARLDDRVRVTVLEEVDPATGIVTPRLARLALGTIVIDSSFDHFLDEGTILSLVRRDHYWRDESVIEFESDGGSAIAQLDVVRQPEIPALPMFLRPRITLALDESVVRFGEDFEAFEAIGYEEMALPGNSYGRARVGVAYQRMRMWSELPLPIGNASTPLIARSLEAAFGAGLSFDTESFGGAITWADASSTVGAAAVVGSDRYLLGRSALAYWRIPGALLGSLGDRLSLRVGAGYRQFVRLNLPGDGIAATAIDAPGLFARGELRLGGETLRPQHTIAAEIFGGSVVASFHEQFTSAFGVRVVGAVHGITGDRPAWLPSYSVLITPTITIW